MNPLVMIGLGIGAFFFFKNKVAGPTPSVPDNGPYFQNFASQISAFTQAYSDGAISLAQWQNYMVNLKGEIAQARANNQVTDSDVQLLYAATGI